MPDLSKLILHSPTPAFKNFQSEELSLTFQGSLPAPTGPDATILTVSGSVDFPEQPAIVNYFVSQNITPDHILADYVAEDLIKIPPYQVLFCNVAANACGDTAWLLDSRLQINAGTLTISLTASNSGGTACDLTFTPTIFTFRYIAYLPTGTV